MKITDIQLGHLSVPLKTPFKTALRTVTHVNDVLVKIHTDTGIVGYGSAAPTAEITGDTKTSITSTIKGLDYDQAKGEKRVTNSDVKDTICCKMNDI